MNHILKLNKLTRQFKSGDKTLTVVDNVTFEIEEGISCAIVGPSGSGKTTLLGLSAGLDQPTSGDVTLNGINLKPLNEDQRAEVRNRHVGFVFQTFQLVPTLTAVENVMVPLELRGEATNTVRERAIELLKEVGLGERSHHYPTQLSGGEQQRVAVARAFINNPKILFADEPTGNLDSKTGSSVMDFLKRLHKDKGKTIIMVTHDAKLASHADRVAYLKDGMVVSHL